MISNTSEIVVTDFSTSDNTNSSSFWSASSVDMNPDIVTEQAIAQKKSTNTNGERPSYRALTSSALHDHDLPRFKDNFVTEKSSGIEKLQSAARSLGFDLPRQSLMPDRWEFDDWLSHRAEQHQRGL